MATTMNRNTVVGVFESREKAQQAINELKRMGFREDQIGVASRHDGKHVENTVKDAAHGDTMAEEGAITGLTAGAGLGALWGLGIIAGVLPVIGPAIAGGTLAAILSSAAAGAAAAGLAGALIGLGIPEDESGYYESEFKSGRTIVTVKADGRHDEAAALLRRFGAYDISNKAGLTSSAAATSNTAMDRQDTHLNTTAHDRNLASSSTASKRTADSNTVQAREEVLHVTKTPVEKGEVHVRKEVHTEQKTINVPVEREEVVIERRPVSGHAASGPIGAGAEEIRIPVREEEVHVEKTNVVKEEVHVGKRKVRGTEQVNETVRKEEIRVEREGDVDVRDERNRR